MERTPLPGREQSLASFVKGLTDVESGHGWTWVIEGEAGIGKSRLLREIGALARERGFGVLTGAGYELGHEHSYGAIAEALELRSSSPDPLRASIAELLRRAPREGHHLEFRVLEDLLALVERLSMERPLVLAMDDLQWVDTASLLALAHVARHATPLRAAIVVALRPPPRRQQADQFLESVAAVACSTSLDPLRRAAVDALLAELVGGVPGVRLRSQIERAGGNPLFIRELVAALRSAGSLVEAGGEVELTGRPLPAGINRLIDRHLRHLPAATGRALRMASVLGCDFSLADLADVMGQPASAIADLVQPALQNGLLGEQGSQMVFRHQLVRDAIYERMPQAMRSALHRDVGRLLAGRGAEVGQVAAHLALGGETARSEAIEWLRRAAREATSTSPALAIEYLDRAIHLAGPRHGERDELLADRVLALTWAGRAPEALQVAGDMLGAGVSSALENRLRLGLARALLAQARWDESARQLELLAAGPGMDEPGRARLLGDAALALALSGSAERAAVHVEEARRIGERLQDDLTLSVVYSALAVLAHFEARHLDSVEASRQAVALAARSRSKEAGTRPAAVWLGNGLKDADEFDEALTVLQVGRRRSEEAGMVWHLPLYDDGIGTVHFHAGDWDDALAEMETGIALAERTGTLWWLVTAKCMMAYIAIHRGQEQLAEASISTAVEHAGSRPSFSQNRLRWVRGLHHEARGEPKAALALLEEAWAATAAAG
ncbi:MAG TPA: AAA family ATPase, partial [Candidatus Eisenbacteria bacterium]|nr:AAA family ATPase [Candidatus Eisenbacteria bacterium]